MRIARHYLKKIPFASAKPYEVFASFISIGNFLQVIEEHLPEECSRRSLLLYYLIPVLQKAAKSDADRERIAIFMSHASASSCLWTATRYTTWATTARNGSTTRARWLNARHRYDAGKLHRPRQRHLARHHAGDPERFEFVVDAGRVVVKGTYEGMLEDPDWPPP